MFNGFYAVLYREISIFRKRLKKQLLSQSLSPLLYLIAFGWGMGNSVVVGNMSYMSFLIPGLITMNSLNQSYAISGEMNISRFYFHTFEQYLTAPVSHFEIVLGEAVFGVLRGVLSGLMIFAFAVVFNVKLQFNAVFIPALLLHTFLFASLAVTTSMVVKDHAGQALVNNFVITPMIFLCGTFYPVDRLPVFFKAVVYMLPLTYSVKVIRASLTGGEINPLYMLLLFAYSVVFFLTAVVALKKVES
ncbi:MAG: ABC transporter permease [Nitrospirae bacterium]|nr:ABC transporter permease [Nitrospirota bacterium]